jgi:toxin ParE1/3/4
LDPSPEIRFARGAQADLEDAARWYADRSQQAFNRLLSAVEHALSLAIEFPDAWPRLSDGEERRIPLRRTPYSLVYRTETRLIIILAIAHSSRRPGYWRSRGE